MMAKIAKLVLLVVFLLSCAAGAQAQTTLYRLDRPGSNDALLTGNSTEIKTLLDAGWKLKGPIGKVQNTSAPFEAAILKPLYRLSYPPTGKKLHTIDQVERDNLVNNLGWVQDSILGYVNPSPQFGAITVNRYFDAPNGSHVFAAVRYSSSTRTVNLDTQNPISSSYVPSGFQLQFVGFYLYPYDLE